MWRAQNSERLVDTVLGLEDLGSTHVNEFQVASLVYHDVLRLDVSVNDVHLVEVLDGE